MCRKKWHVNESDFFSSTYSLEQHYLQVFMFNLYKYINNFLAYLD